VQDSRPRLSKPSAPRQLPVVAATTIVHMTQQPIEIKNAVNPIQAHEAGRREGQPEEAREVNPAEEVIHPANSPGQSGRSPHRRLAGEVFDDGEAIFSIQLTPNHA